MSAPVLGEVMCPDCSRLRPTVEKRQYTLRHGHAIPFVYRVIADHQRDPLWFGEHWFLRLTGRDTTPKCEGSGQGVQL